MRSFIEYVLVTESTALNESTFSVEDFKKHDYLQRVLSDITTLRKVDIGKKSVQDTISLSDDAIDQFKELYTNINRITMQQFNDVARQYGFTWTKIYKGKYSGHDAGQSAGENAEPAVSYIFNTMKNNKLDNATIKVLDDNKVNGDWLQSSTISAKKLLTMFKNTDYVAAHVNGRDFKKLPQEIANIAMIFFGKAGICKALNIKNKHLFDDLYVGGKDNWNKADIVLVNKHTAPYAQLLDSNIQSSQQLNSVLNQLIENNDIIPVSLKKILPGTDLKNVMFKKEGKSNSVSHEDSEINSIKRVGLVFPKRLEAGSQNGSCYLLTDNNIMIHFRRQADTKDNLSIDLIFISARGGKPLIQIKKDLGLTDNSYYAMFESEQDFFDQLSEVLPDCKFGSIPPMLKDQVPDWYTRTCFKGLVGLLREYYSKYENTTVIDFVKYVYDKATGQSSESIFYLLTMK